MSNHQFELQSGQRFPFGKNWRAFLSAVNTDRILLAEQSLKGLLEVDSLEGLTVLDVGSGSGLLSLAARRLGAKVHSFDYDPESVACTQELKSRYRDGDLDWKIENGSILDEGFLRGLGTYDIVYSWGVLHHTGKMWQALENVAGLVKANGQLALAIYNDQGGQSRRWRKIKRIYCGSWLGRNLVMLACMSWFLGKALVVDLLRLRNPGTRYSEHRNRRGMSILRDYHDWLGGLPFEVARPEQVFDFYRERKFMLQKLRTQGGDHGNNEFVFKRGN